MTAGSAPPVFLDRDGTLIVEKEYLADPLEVIVEDGVVDGLTALTRNRHPLIVLSNQSGIGRGRFDEADARRVNARIADLLRPHGIEIRAWYFCPHAPEARCTCRKPLPGMAWVASRECNLNLSGSYVIGDKHTDLQLADAIGGTGILVTTGHGRRHVDWARSRARPVFETLRDAADYITQCAVPSAATP